jgi:NAD(P)-dependent dehydrogenase (short-subunit alcohol dehydrogenase family)
MQQRFIDRTVLITGAGGAIGRAAAERFAAEGARLALVDRDAEPVAQLARQLGEQGHVAFGHLHVVFNNAGIGGQDLPIADLPSAQWDEIIAVNLRGVFLGCKYSVPALVRAGGGAIVNMGSSTGRHDTLPGSAAYMASKAAIEALTKSLALQVACDGIRVNAICPGIIQTQLSLHQKNDAEAERFFARFAERIPLGRVGQPEDVAAAVAFLACDQARLITGTALLIDGGQTMRRWISTPDLAPHLP